MADNVVERVEGIEGLTLLRGAAGPETVERIIDGLRRQKWARWHFWRKFSRQDFGYRYQITSRDVQPGPAIPEEIKALFPALREAGWQGEQDPTQVIVTRYPVGGCLGIHTDSDVFGPEVAGVSLGEEWPVCFTPPGRRGRERPVPMPVLSAYVRRGPAREAWLHRVPPTFNGERISLTFRTLSGSGPRKGTIPPSAARRRASAAQAASGGGGQPGLFR